MITIDLPPDTNSTQYVMVRNTAHDLTSEDKEKDIRVFVTGPPGALLFDVKPEIALK